LSINGAPINTAALVRPAVGTRPPTEAVWFKVTFAVPHPPDTPTANGYAPNMSGNPELPWLGVLAFASAFPQPSLVGA